MCRISTRQMWVTLSEKKCRITDPVKREYPGAWGIKAEGFMSDYK